MAVCLQVSAGLTLHRFWCQIYNELVSEMNINKTGLPLAIHRKKSVSFRDKSLLAIFQVAMQTLNQVVSGSYGQLAANQVMSCACRTPRTRGRGPGDCAVELQALADRLACDGVGERSSS